MQEQFTEYKPTKACPICARMFDGSVKVCDVDGYELVQAEDDPLIGTWLLDRYVILSVLGAGGWGKVYKARHLTLGTVVAIKTLYLHLASNREKVTRFEQEARAACSLRHENIAAVYDFGTMPNGQPFIVMDFLGGENLYTVLQNEKYIEPLRAVNIFKQIASGLAAAHDRGIVHRDIKPGNIVLLPDFDKEELVKLFDFGLAKLHMEDGTSLNQLTQTGETVGTPAYMSPEQCQGWKLDQRTDLYSLGCVMYECLTGKQAFAGPTTYECMSKHVNDNAQAFSTVTPPGIKIPLALEEIVFKALEKDPKRRYQTAREMLSDLQKIEDKQPPSIGSFTIQRAVLRRPFRNILRLVQKHKPASLLAATTLILLATTCLFAYQGGWPGVDSSQMPPNDRWLYHTKLGTRALVEGNYGAAEDQFKKALTVAETFSTPDKRRVILANQALLFHLTMRPDLERLADKQLDQLMRHEPVPSDDRSRLDPAELELLSAMLDKVTDSKPVDKRQLRLFGDRINRLCVCAGDAIANKPERQLEEKNCKALQAYLGTDNDTYGLCLQRLGYANFLDGNHKDALALWLQCLPIRRQYLKKTDPEYVRLLADIGEECVRNGKLDEAERHLEEAAELWENDMLHAREQSVLSNLALVYERQGNSRQEYETWKRLYDLIDRGGDYDQCDTPFLALVFSGNRLTVNPQTEQFLRDRRAALLSHYGQVSQGVAAYSLALAELYLVEQRYPEAEKAARDALEIRQMLQLPGYIPVRRAMETLARACLAQGKLPESLSVYEVYLACAERNVVADNDKGLLLDALTKTAYLNSKLARDKRASDYMVRAHVLISAMKPASSGYDCTRAIDGTFTALKGRGLSMNDYIQLEQLIGAQAAVCDRDGSIYTLPNPKACDALSRIYELAGRLKDAQGAEDQAITLVKARVPTYAWVPGRVYLHYSSILNLLGKTVESQQAAREAAEYPNDAI
jgi:serine/threonine protein kinase